MVDPILVQFAATVLISGGVVAGTYEWIRYYFNKKREEAVAMTYKKMDTITKNISVYVHLSGFFKQFCEELDSLLSDSNQIKRKDTKLSFFYLCKFIYFYRKIIQDSGGLQLDNLDSETVLTELETSLVSIVKKTFGRIGQTSMERIGRESDDYISFLDKIPAYSGLTAQYRIWLFSLSLDDKVDVDTVSDLILKGKLHHELMVYEINLIFRLWYREKPNLPIFEGLGIKPQEVGLHNFSILYMDREEHRKKYFHRVVSVVPRKSPVTYMTKILFMLGSLGLLTFIVVLMLLRII